MHRSGTSLVASWLLGCGIRLDVGELMGPNIGNIRGHFEDNEVVSLQSDELAARVENSHGWQVRRPVPQPFTDAGRRRAAELVRQRNELHVQWGWKDPRSVLFLGEWRRICPDLRVVLLWRPAADVVASLIRRAAEVGSPEIGISADDALAVWGAYNRLALGYKQAFPDETILVPISHVLRDDARLAYELHHRFGLELDYQPLAEVYEPDLLDAARSRQARREIPRRPRAGIERALRRHSDL